MSSILCWHSFLAKNLLTQNECQHNIEESTGFNTEELFKPREYNAPLQLETSNDPVTKIDRGNQCQLRKLHRSKATQVKQVNHPPEFKEAGTQTIYGKYKNLTKNFKFGNGSNPK